jgi:MFS family permease
MPLMFQLGFGLTAFQSGSITCAAAAGAISMKLGAAKLIRTFGFRRLLMVNGILASLSIVIVGFVSPQTSFMIVMALLFVGGFLRSLQFTAMNAMTYSDVDNAAMSSATSLYTVAQQLSLSAGVVIGAFVLEAARHWRGEATLQPADFSVAFLVVGVLALGSVMQFFRLEADAGASVSGRRSAALNE